MIHQVFETKMRVVGSESTAEVECLCGERFLATDVSVSRAARTVEQEFAAHRRACDV